MEKTVEQLRAERIRRDMAEFIQYVIQRGALIGMLISCESYEAALSQTIGLKHMVNSLNDKLQNVITETR